jgi:hypothetical protein
MGWKDWLPNSAKQAALAAINPAAFLVGKGMKQGVLPNPFNGDGGSAEEQRAKLTATGDASNQFAGVGEAGYQGMTEEMARRRQALQRIADGRDSVSAEHLRQGLGQQLSMHRSMAAGASPANSAMAARTAAIQMGRAQTGLAGQQALAGLAERQQAQQALSQLDLGQRGQDLQAALGARGTAVQAFGSGPEQKSWWDRYGPAMMQGASGAASMAAMSDRRLKEDIEDGDKDANKAISGLKAFSFRYSDDRYGKGKQVGIMAQDLEKVGLKHAIVETPAGKAVDGAKAATTGLAMIAALGRRVASLEKGKGRK